MNLIRNTITTALAAVFTVPLITGAAAAPPTDNEFTVDKTLTQQITESNELIGSAKYGEGEFAHVYMETIDYETRVVKDNKLPKGVEVVATEGKPGTVKHFIVEDEKLYSTVDEQPQEEVIRRGENTSHESPAIAPELIERWEKEEAERKEKEAQEKAEKEQRKKEQREQQEAAERSVSTDSSGSSNNSSNSSSSTTSSGLGSKSDGCGGWRHLVEKHFGNEVAKGCSVLKCESQGNPKAQNPYSSASGGWQFIDGTWRAVRHAANASNHARAMDATPEQQTIAAKHLRDTSGWGQWVCQ